MRLGRILAVLSLAVAAPALVSSALAGPTVPLSQTRVVKKTIAVTLPGEGDATLASIVLTGKVKPGGGTLALPRVRVANADSLPASVSIAASTTRLKGKKNRFLLAVVVINRQPATVGRALDKTPGPQVVIEARVTPLGKNDLKGIGVDLREAVNLLGSASILPASTCTRLLEADVSPPAKFLQQPLGVSAAVVLEITPKVVCGGDGEARIQLEALAQKQSLPTTECSGMFLPYDATEVSFQIRCPAAASSGRALAVQSSGFDVQLAGGRRITALLSPAGFTCTITTRATTNDTLSCAGAIVSGITYTGNIRMSPGPTTGMGGTLSVFENGVQVGTFAMTGP